jgi:hypothetical protein
VEILTCETCDMIGFRSVEGAPLTHVQQTRDRVADCGFIHDWVIVGDVDARAFTHVALSTVLRRVTLSDWHRVGIRSVQTNLAAQRVNRRVGWPSRLVDGHDVTPDGLVVARVMARTIAGQVPYHQESLMWRSAAGLLSVAL